MLDLRDLREVILEEPNVVDPSGELSIAHAGPRPMFAVVAFFFGPIALGIFAADVFPKVGGGWGLLIGFAVSVAFIVQLFHDHDDANPSSLTLAYLLASLTLVCVAGQIDRAKKRRRNKPNR